MEKLFRFFAVCSLLFSAAIYPAEEEIRKGLSYEHIVTSVPQSIHILKMDPEYCFPVLKRALDAGIGKETVSSLVTRTGAVVGINGGFFQIGGLLDGSPRGILKIGDRWFSLPDKPRGAIGWERTGNRVLIDRLLASCFIIIKDQEIEISGINKKRNPGETIVYTSDFHRTTLTDPGGVEYVIRDGKLSEIIENRGSNRISETGWVVSKGPDATLSLSRHIGEELSLDFRIFPQETPSYTKGSDWKEMDYILGGTPVLVRDGTVIKDFSSEKTIETFLTKRHSRTAVGIREDGLWVFVIVDGKRPGESEGMTMDELAGFMADLGCKKALNLDGGGSSTMVIEGKVTNVPFGDEDESPGKQIERRVSDAILIFEKKTSLESKLKQS